MPDTQSHSGDTFLTRIASKNIVVGIIGMGYVGLPLAVAFGGAGIKVLGFDLDAEKAEKLNAGESYIKHITSERVAALRNEQRLEATADMSRLAEPDALLICVPTPLTKHHEPDLSYVVSTTETVAKYFRPGQIVILESTTYPGTTKEVMQPILECGGLKAGQDFFLAYSPEREDPGNLDFSTSRIPKVVGGSDCLESGPTPSPAPDGPANLGANPDGTRPNEPARPDFRPPGRTRAGSGQGDCARCGGA